MGGRKSKSLDASLGSIKAELKAGHTDCINCIAVSEDGSLFASGSDDCTIRLWSEQSNEGEVDGDLTCSQILIGHSNYINQLVFHGNFYLVSTGADCTLRKWDVASASCLFVMEGHQDIINQLICSDDYILSTSSDRTAICWSFATGEVVQTFQGHRQRVTCVDRQSSTSRSPHKTMSIDKNTPVIDPSNRQHPSGGGMLGRRLVYTGSADHTAKAWSIRSGKCCLTFTGHQGPITQLAVLTSVGGGGAESLLLTASHDSTIRCWFSDTGRIKLVMRGHRGPILYMTMFDSVIYTGSMDRTVRSWLVQTGDPIRRFAAQKGSVTSIRFHQNKVLTGSEDGRVRAYDAKNGKLLQTYTLQITDCCNAFEYNGKYLVASGNDGKLYVWNTLEQKHSEQVPHVTEEVDEEAIQSS